MPIEIADDRGFRNRNFGRHATAANQDRLDRLGNAMPANLLRPETRHQTDRQAAQDGGDDHPWRARDGAHRDNGGADLAKPDKIGDESYQFHKKQSRERATRSDDEGHCDQRQHATICREIPELLP